MNTIEVTEGALKKILDTEVPYFMSYLWEVVSEILDGNRWVESLIEISERVYPYVKQDSDLKDQSYAEWDFGRLWILAWGPEESQFFFTQRDKCIQILESFL